MNKAERIDIIDYLKAIAILFVIFDHIGLFPIDSILYCFMVRMAVPIFMTLSGYTFAMSYTKKKSFRDMYDWSFVKGKLFRFLTPAVVACIIIWLVSGKKDNVLQMLLTGGYGPGSYYPGLMLQLLLIFPILLKVLEGKKGNLLVIIAVNILWEISAWMFQFNDTIYRILIFRYITYIALGILLYAGIRLPVWSLVFSFCCGVLYIFAIGRWGYQPYIFRNWSNTALPVALYIFPIMYLFLNKMEHFKIDGFIGECFTTIGKASYHILFAQMFTRIIWQEYGGINFWSVIFIRVIGSVVLGVVIWECENRGKKLKR